MIPLWFALVIAAVNLAVGAAVATALVASRGARAAAPRAGREPAPNGPESSSPEGRGDHASTTPGGASPADASHAAGPSLSAAAGSDRQTPAPRRAVADFKSWDVVADELLKRAAACSRELAAFADRLQQPDDASDNNGLATIENRFEELLRTWSAESEPESQQALTLIRALPGGSDVAVRFENALLQLGAQVETSLSNCHAIDVSDAAAARQRLHDELHRAAGAYELLQSTWRRLIDLVHQSRALVN